MSPNAQFCPGFNAVADPPPKTHGVPLVGATTAKSAVFAPEKLVALFKVALAVPLFVMVTFVVELVLETV